MTVGALMFVGTQEGCCITTAACALLSGVCGLEPSVPLEPPWQVKGSKTATLFDPYSNGDLYEGHMREVCHSHAPQLMQQSSRNYDYQWMTVRT